MAAIWYESAIWSDSGVGIGLIVAVILFDSRVGYRADRAGYLVSRVRILNVKADQEVCM